MKLSVVVPVYNEVGTIDQILDRVRRVPIEKEIIVVDDCSTDGTRARLAALDQREAGFRVILHDTNQGKGAALRTGFAQATGDIVIIQDADLEYDPQDYPRLVAPIAEGRSRVVFGVRSLDRQKPLLRLGIECQRFDLEPEITAKIARLGQPILEVPISYAPREQKKLSPWKDGLPALKALLRYRRWSPEAPSSLGSDAR